jgi:ditrans,polycis-polyprenyl diphosphate synthase
MLEILRIVQGWIIRLILAVLAAGPVPHHVGFVMDGNRRYARMHGRKVLDGHGQGLESLKGVCSLSSLM